MQGAQWWSEDGLRGGLDRYLPPSGTVRSHMPEELVDGEVESPDRPEDEQLSHEAASPEVAAKRLDRMSRGEDRSA